MNKIVIYTSLTGGYDNLPQYEVVDPNFDYICFTNDYPAESKVGQWEIRPIPVDLKDNQRLSRYSKLMPHTVLENYEWSVWLDANLVIVNQKFYTNIFDKIKEGGLWYGIKHPSLDCIYEDAVNCIIGAKEKFKNIKPQIDFLKKEGFPRHYGLFENNVILRQHNSDIIKPIDELWWNIFIKYSKRDQLSLFYVFWKKNFNPDVLLPNSENTHNSCQFKFIKHKQISFIKRVSRKLTSWHNQILLIFMDKI